MTNYSTYRISETFRVLFFITISILVLNLFPVTALMIVLLAILNDLPVITIAYDNVRYSNSPEKWNMRSIIGLASMLGVIGVISSFGIFYIGLQVFALSPAVLQSFMYLKLSVAGHLTLLWFALKATSGRCAACKAIVRCDCHNPVYRDYNHCLWYSASADGVGAG
jgi:H+-transporting ATPase